MAGDCATRISDTLDGEHTIVLLHGYLESLDIWEGFTRLLAPRFRVLAIDLPGHGVSQVKGETHTMEFLADTVAAAMRREGIGRAVIVGHSMGGYVALAMMAKYPDMTDGLVLLHSSPEADSDKKREDRQREIDIITGGKKELLARIFPQEGFAPDNRRRLHEAIEAFAEQIFLTEDDGITALLRGMRDRPDMSESMHKSPIPQLVILGRHDVYVTPEDAARMLAAQPQAQVVWLESSGHMGFLEQPEECAGAITAFADGIYGSPVGKE